MSPPLCRFALGDYAVFDNHGYQTVGIVGGYSKDRGGDWVYRVYVLKGGGGMLVFHLAEGSLVQPFEALEGMIGMARCRDHSS